MADAIQILVVDDHPLMREALCEAIVDEPDMVVAGTAANGVEGLAQARALHPDVVIMDLLLPGMGGIEAIAALCTEDPEAHVLVLTSSTEESKLLAAVEAGALGYLLKDAERDQILQAIRSVSRGDPSFSPVLARKLLATVRQGRAVAPVAPSAELLTAREQEVLGMMGHGSTNRDIAATLSLSDGTVRTHVRHILHKLGLANRQQAILYALRQGPDHRS